MMFGSHRSSRNNSTTEPSSPAAAHSPSLGSMISTVAVDGNSVTPITGSDSRIWKVSARSYLPSTRMRTRHVALVCPGLNWTCRWDFPLKSSSFLALPSSVPMPESWWQVDTDDRGGVKKNKRRRPGEWGGGDEREIRYSHSLMLLRRRWGTESCVLFSLTDHSRSLGSA